MSQPINNQKKEPGFFTIMAIVAGFALVGGWLKSSDAPPAPPSHVDSRPEIHGDKQNKITLNNPPSRLKPEMIVHFTKGTLACLSKDDLQEAIEHGIKGENTKLHAMMVQNGGTCVMISPSQSAKIISVEYNDPNMPDMGLVEVVGKGITAAHGAWALSLGAEAVKENKTAPGARP